MECKVFNAISFDCVISVLIETLWNVKRVFLFITACLTGINRNIVECKGMKKAGYKVGIYCINRNIVECKDSFFDCPLVPLLVLIETLWNVKSVDHLQVDFSLRINRNIVECKVGITLTCLECSG